MSILLSSACVETLHTSRVCCVIGISSLSDSVNIFLRMIHKKESSPVAVLLLTLLLSSFIKPSILFPTSSSVKLVAWL